MKQKEFFIAHNSAIDRALLLRLLSAGLTSVLLRPSAALWRLAGRTLVGQHAYDAIQGGR